MVSPAAREAGIVSSRVSAPLKRSSQTSLPPLVWFVRNTYPVGPGNCSRAFRRRVLLTPGSVVSRAHTSTSGPYWALLRQAVHVVVTEQASWLDATFKPPSPLMIAFVQRPASESGFSLARLKSSSGAESEVGATAAIGVAFASFDVAPSPFALSAETL
jgi:hypothetical protein